VDEDGSAEDGVGGWVEGTGNEWSDGEWDEADGDQALEGPVVGTVGWVMCRKLGGFVGCGIPLVIA
jgi:hypothetical protein